MIRVNKKQFEAVCKEICQDIGIKERITYLKKGSNRYHYLRPPLEKIALTYFPHIVAGSRLALLAEIVVKIA